MLKRFFICCCLLPSIWLAAQQVPDKSYEPKIENPMYTQGEGSVILIDQGHENFHTKDGNYWAFAHLLERDGYRLGAHEGKFTKESLEKGKILVVSNALNKVNIGKWYLPTPSAFSSKEIDEVKNWVAQGGSLFLIADHMPMAGAAEALAAAFGFKFTNGFVFNTTSNSGTAYFKIADKTLQPSIITEGRNANEAISEVVSFTGQGFQIPDKAKPVLNFGDSYVNLLPDTAWVFKDIPRTPVKGWSQGAFMKHGKGRVVMWGEAAMFTAQLAGPNKRKFGMSLAIAKENYQLLLNIIHWLDGRLEEQ